MIDKRQFSDHWVFKPFLENHKITNKTFNTLLNYITICMRMKNILIIYKNYFIN